ncbi:aldo/keto reductase [Actinomadura rudentiformis]|uniref:Aldo/keto reductase n=1 Tax=Actinomadura rudentiformis TaxID=359158 RepID=A0A6H9YS40_9ACTN|nr:aldo/keto reductase [Actinomadura rudentiformis]KAB2346818.1 aldo/keto reductase [Actinomadura rudentiformis]
MNGAERLAIGLAAVGRPAYINLGRTAELPAERTVDDMRQATWDVLDAAYAAEIRWVDTARSYGRAEEFLGEWLAERGHTDITVSSKWGYAYVGEWRLDSPVHELKEHSLERFKAQYAETRRFLGRHLDLYQVHSLTTDSPLFGDRALQAALAGLAAEGVRVGFSTSGPRQADTVLKAFELEVDGQQVFTAVQSTWNLLEPSAAGALHQAHDDAGALVLVKEALANGRLAVQPPEEIKRVADLHDVSADAVALAAALRQVWADRVLLGAVSPAQLRSNLAALSVGEDELNELATPPERYWAERAALPWT